MEKLGSLDRFDQSANRAAAEVISAFSTSFSLATRALSPQIRTDISNLYAVVRIADEIVDGTALEAGLPPEDVAATLDAYEQQILQAPGHRFHTDPVVHAYAQTARRCGFKPECVQAFFASMRRDLHQSNYTNVQDFSDYVYGSAEVIGLLCLDAFLVDTPVSPTKRRELETGARHLGAAFQKINFLRDFGADTSGLGRSYFPEVEEAALNDATKTTLITDIRADIAAARAVTSYLPVSARIGVEIATDIFEELTTRLDKIPAAQIQQSRVRVSNPRKLSMLPGAILSALKAKPSVD